MALPLNLIVGLPRTFGELVRNTFMRYDAPEIDVAQTLHGSWLEVRGGELPVPVSVRIDRAEDGRFMVTGLLIGLNSREELTWQTLRDIKPATILSYIFSGFDPRQPARQVVADTESHTVTVDGETFDVDAWIRGDDDDQLPVLTDAEMRESLRVNAAYQLWHGAQANPPFTKPSRSRTSASSDVEEVTQVWLKHKAITPWRATNETAKELSVSRATVLRRIKEAERLGVIPHGTVAASRARQKGEAE